MDKSGPDGLRELLATPEPAGLGPERRAGTLAQYALETRLDELFGQAKLPAQRQRLIRALILLWHDHLDAAHALAQDDETADGSFIHAIMHRREPDAWNSKYWFRRVGKHPAFPEIGRRVAALLAVKDRQDLVAKLVPRGEWDPSAFVDACEHPDGDSELLREIQRIEFEVLLSQ